MGFLAMKTRFTDGVMIRDTVYDSDGAHALLYQDPNQRKAILDRNQQLRKEDALTNMQHMGLELTIPLEDYYTLLRNYPDLKSPDKQTRDIAWRTFMGTSECTPYRVRPNVIVY